MDMTVIYTKSTLYGLTITRGLVVIRFI